MVCRYPAYFPGSTNPLDLYAIWPGEWSTKGMAALAQRTVLAMGALGSWQQGNALPEMVPAAVRAGVEPGWILGNLSARVNATMAQSGVMAEGAETQGATQVSAAQHPVKASICSVVLSFGAQGVNDMLCSSFDDGIIRLFDHWPLDEDASFQTLRTQGGFLVSATLRSRVVETGVRIRATADGTATLADPPGWSGGIVVKDGAGRTVPASAGSEPQTWTWPAKAGDAFVVNFAAGH